MIRTDLCIIGAGPVGLFAIFEAGLLKLRCHLIDALPQVGGQLSEIYPHKPIYDIPGYPTVNAQELVDNLMKQAAPFNPSFTLGERVEEIERLDGGSFVIRTNDQTEVEAKAIVIAGGLGCFEPRRPELTDLQLFEKTKSVRYMVKNPEDFRGKKIVLAGGGDSALDWTVFLADIAAELTLVHRNEGFRGAPDTAAKVLALAEQGKINLLLSSDLHSLKGENGLLEAVNVSKKNGEIVSVPADYLIPLYGLSPKLGPIANWGLNLDKNAIVVNVEDYSTNVPGIYAIGDINTYPGKLKLILSGFHEAALMSHGVYKRIFPERKLSLKYTTVNGIESF